VALTFFWRFQNSLTLDGTHDFSAGDTTAVASGTATFSTTQARDGYAGFYDGPLDYHTFDPTSICSRAAGSVGLWFHATTNWNDPVIIFRAYGSSSNDYVRLRLRGTNGAGNVDIGLAKNGASAITVATTSAALSLATWYFVRASWDFTAGNVLVRVYNASGVLQGTEGFSSAWGATQYPATEFATMEIGEISGANTDPYIDNLFIGSAYADGDTFLTKRDITSYTEYVGASRRHPFVGKFGFPLIGQI
jgi:hypothetical protein